ncbi:hypothetical protein ACTXT7_017309, partial [Hymenolepis weldensis]
DPKDYVKNVGILHHNLILDETPATWYTQHRDIYKNIMADLPHATRITMLLCEFNRSDNYLYSSYFQPMDLADLTYEKVISKSGSVVRDNGSLQPDHKLLSLVDKEPDIKKFCHRPKSAEGLLTESVQSERA